MPETVVGQEYNLHSITSFLYDKAKPDELGVTSRHFTEYQRVLGLSEVLLSSQAKVLDVGSGNSVISAADFGLSQNNLVRIDIDPKQPSIKKGNVLQLDFPSESFDEVWAMFVLKYLDPRLPSDVAQNIDELTIKNKLEQSGFSLRQKVAELLGLTAIGEMLRVVKPGGRVRIGSYAYDINQSKSIKTFLSALVAGEINGVGINGTEVKDTLSDPERVEINLFFEKTEDYNPEMFNSFLQNEYHRLIPQELNQALKTQIKL